MIFFSQVMDYSPVCEPPSVSCDCCSSVTTQFISASCCSLWNIQVSFYQAEREVLPGAIIYFHVLKIINLRNVEPVTAHRPSRCE